MLRTAIFSLMILSSLSGIAQRRDPRDAVLESLRSVGISADIDREQVLLSSDRGAGVPSIEHSRYDGTLHGWLIELRCPPPRHCVPTLAVLNIADPRLLENAPVRQQRPVLVRAGGHRSLLSDFGSLRLREPVVCLESGRAGQVVRVRVAETRRVKLAEITESGELRLRIPR